MSSMFGNSPGNRIAIDKFTSTTQRFSFTSLSVGAVKQPIAQPGRKAEFLLVSSRTTNTTNILWLWNETVDALLPGVGGSGIQILSGAYTIISVDNQAWDFMDSLVSIFQQAMPDQQFVNNRSRNEFVISDWYVAANNNPTIVDVCIGYGPQQ